MRNIRNIVYFIAPKDFRDEEYFIPVKLLEQFGSVVKTASTCQLRELAVGALGGEAKIEALAGSIKSSDFDALVIAGGPGALKYLDNEKIYSVIREFVKTGKLVAAVCIAPVILAHANVLQGKKVTVWNTPLEQRPVKELARAGALYLNQPVVVDGSIITANGPEQAQKFGKAIIDWFGRAAETCHREAGSRSARNSDYPE